MSAREITLELAGIYAPLTLADLPAGVVDAALISLADGLACMMAATHEAAVAAPRAHALRSAGSCTVLGESRKATASAAALANGALAHAVDFEDTFEAGMIHPNASVIPAVLALAEETGAAGDAVITALAIGCDAACRLSLVMGTDAARRGWYHPPMITAVGAAFACAHLLHLTPAQTVNAVGLTLCQFSLGDGLIATPKSHLRAMREGLAARAAVEGARLAELGVEAVREPLFAGGGMVHLLLGEMRDGAAMLDEAGQHFHGPAVGIKVFPSCRGTHGPVQLALALREQGISPADIAQIRMRVAPVNRMLFEPVMQKHAPQSAIEAKFSSPFCFATALRSGTLDLTSFLPAAVADEATRALARKVLLAEDDPQTGEVDADIRLTDGRDLRLQASGREWRIADMVADDLLSKIRGCAAASGADFDAARFLDAVRGLAKGGIAPVFAALSSREAPGN